MNPHQTTTENHHFRNPILNYENNIFHVEDKETLSSNRPDSTLTEYSESDMFSFERHESSMEDNRITKDHSIQSYENNVIQMEETGFAQVNRTVSNMTEYSESDMFDFERQASEKPDRSNKSDENVITHEYLHGNHARRPRLYSNEVMEIDSEHHEVENSQNSNEEHGVLAEEYLQGDPKLNSYAVESDGGCVTDSDHKQIIPDGNEYSEKDVEYDNMPMGRNHHFDFSNDSIKHSYLGTEIKDTHNKNKPTYVNAPMFESSHKNNVESTEIDLNSDYFAFKPDQEIVHTYLHPGRRNSVSSTSEKTKFRV